MKAKLQQDTVKAIVAQRKKSDKVEFDSSLMTVDEFADCYKAALAVENATIVESADPMVNLPEGSKDGK